MGKGRGLDNRWAGPTQKGWSQTKVGVAWVKAASQQWDYQKGEESVERREATQRGTGDGDGGEVMGNGEVSPPELPPSPPVSPLPQRPCAQPPPSPWSASSSCSPPSSSATSATSARRGPFWPSFLESSSSYRVSPRKTLTGAGGGGRGLF